MYSHDLNQPEFEDFYLPFGGRLRSDNRWVVLAKLIPWKDIEKLYSKNFSSNGMGAPAKPARMALGALIIKERLGASDEETVEQITENPYLQYFLGLSEYSNNTLFDASMFVHFRKRFSLDIVNEINEIVVKKALKLSVEEQDPEEDIIDDPPTHKGKLLIDATCAPADITFPTDLKLLNKGRELTEKIIDQLHKPLIGIKKKPRDYRKEARKQYLKTAKSKRLSNAKRRKAIRKQLNFVKRNLKHIETLEKSTSLTTLSNTDYRNLLIVSELYRQQQELFDSRSKRIDDRIVSVSQPHVRPVVRGKASVKTEFGAKLSAGLTDGYVFLERLGWNNYNESEDLIHQVKSYKKRFGCYPESVHADQIYRNRNNRKFCKEHGIRLSGPALGRPPKETEQNKDLLAIMKKQTRVDEIDRIPIEGKFGQAKRRFSLGRIMAKLSATGECSIAITFLVMNLEKWQKQLLFWLLVQTHTVKIRIRDVLMCMNIHFAAVYKINIHNKIIHNARWC
jgi:hypothetical protein